MSQSIALFIEGTYPWYRGGVSEWVYQYIKAFPDLSFHIVQVSTDEYRNADLSSALYSIPSQVMDFIRVPPPRQNFLTTAAADKWFQQVVGKVMNVCAHAPILHIANTGFAGWLGLKIARQTSLPLILTEHALYWKEVQMGAVALECGYRIPETVHKKAAMKNLFQSMATEIYSSADEIISVSKCNIPEQQALGAGDVRYIPNGVSEGWLRPAKKRNARPVIGWIGRCAAMKNPLKFFDVVRAFEKQPVIRPDFMMMICDAGEPGLKAEVLNAADRHPRLQLIINQPTENFIGQMDALCITSHNESQPLVLIEALSKKVMPVGWEAGDVTCEYGLIVPQSAAAEVVAQSFYEIWKQPDTWKRRVDHNFKRVKEMHTWENIFKKYRSLFFRYTKGAPDE